MLNKLKELFMIKQPLAADVDDETLSNYMTREKVIVFIISFILAFCLWFIVNLNRDFTITINLPVDIGDLPDDMALVGDPPESASVGLTGEGWNLISLYNNPPRIIVNAEESEVNLFDMVQQQISSVSDVSITKVEPLGFNLDLEEKAYKRVPVQAQLDIRTSDRFGLIGTPVISPDSVTVSGAGSIINEIEAVRTREETLEDVREGRELQLDIERPAPGVEISPVRIHYRFDVTEFTEGEVRIPLRIRNLPPGQAVTYNPSTITVRYGVPIDQYTDVQNARPFLAYVDYETIEADTTGLVIPEIERTEDEFDIRLRSFQPRTVSYFRVLDNNNE
jgi:YbbR domain-containing protein